MNKVLQQTESRYAADPFDIFRQLCSSAEALALEWWCCKLPSSQSGWASNATAERLLHDLRIQAEGM